MNHSSEQSAPTQPPAPASHPDAATLPPQSPPPVSAALTNDFVPAPVEEMTELPQLPGYEILREVGRGGMGVVYQARHVALGRIVALKMILAGSFADNRMIARFRAEAATLARLQHPHIVQVYDIGTHEGKTYFSLEYVSGGSLDQFLKSTPQPPQAAAALIADLADAVHAAHQAGVVHRDLKPGNILLQLEDGRRIVPPEKERAVPLSANSHRLATIPKVTDFGLAKQTGSQEGLTATGAVMGTPSYMAPEQAEGKNVGPATDIYALGAILYEMLTGRPPFKATTPLDTIMQVVHEEPVPPGKLQPGTPKDVETICMKCLQKDPAKRYATAADLAADLRRFLHQEPIIARPVSNLERAIKWAQRRPAVAGLLAALLVVVATALVMLFSLWMEAEQQRQAAVVAQRLAEERAAALDQRVYAVDMMQALDAWNLADLDGCQAKLDRYRDSPLRGFEWHHFHGLLRQTASQRLAPDAQATPFGVESVACHPHGTLLAVAGSGAEIQVWNLRTRTMVQRLPVVRPVRSLVFTPEGTLLATNGGGVDFWNVANGQRVRRLQASDKPLSRLSLSRNGRRLATVDEGDSLRVWDLPGGTVVQENDKIALAALSPDGGTYGYHLGDRVTGVLGAHTDIGSVTDLEDVRVYTHTLATVLDLAFSPNGQRFAVAGYDANRIGEVRIYDVEAVREVCRCVGGLKAVRCIAFSPDNQFLASGSDDNTVRLWDVKTGKEVRRFRGLGHWYTCLAFSRDGKWLLAGSRDAGVERWPLDQDQEAQTHQLKARSAVFSLALHPDGGHFLIVNLLTLRVAQYDPVAGRQRHVLDVPTRGLAFGQSAHSPDGHLLALGYQDGAVRLVDARSGRFLRTLAGLRGPVRALTFSPDSAVVSAADATPAVVVWNAATGRVMARVEQHTALQTVSALALGPRGEQLLTGHMTSALQHWDIAQGQLRATLQPPAKTANVQPVVALDAQGQRAAFALATAEAAADLVQVFDLPTRTRLFQLSGHAKPVTHLAFSPDGLRLASGSADGTVRLWDMRTGQEVLRLRIPEEALADLRFTSDGERLQALGRNHWVRTWSAPQP